MPHKNRVKIYGEKAFYHVYNRGYNKQEVFRDEQDYKTFLYLLKKYLEPGFKEKKYTPAGEEYYAEPNHVYNEIELLAFCLMPNHFHLLLYQISIEGMPKLLRRVMTSYSTYHNEKYQLEGSPFQGVYKAVTVKTEAQLLHLSRYIHLNPLELVAGALLNFYGFSSYPFYLSETKPPWLKPERILQSFTGAKDYKDFVEDFASEKTEDEKEKVDLLKDLRLE